MRRAPLIAGLVLALSAGAARAEADCGTAETAVQRADAAAGSAQAHLERAK